MKGMVECIPLVARAACSRGSSGWGRLLAPACAALEELSAALRAGLSLSAACAAKLFLEASVQASYYRLLGVEPGEAERRIARRSRGAASFTASMVKRLRGVHGSVKKWVLRAYLRLGEYTHPSTRLHHGARPSHRELAEALDAGLYVLLVSGIAEVEGLDPAALARYGLERSARLLARREG